MEVVKHIAAEQVRDHTVFACAECGEPIGMREDWYTVDGDTVCARPDCGPMFEELASPEGQARLEADRNARPAQYR